MRWYVPLTEKINAASLGINLCYDTKIEKEIMNDKTLDYLKGQY